MPRVPEVKAAFDPKAKTLTVKDCPWCHKTHVHEATTHLDYSDTTPHPKDTFKDHRDKDEKGNPKVKPVRVPTLKAVSEVRIAHCGDRHSDLKEYSVIPEA